MKRESKLNVVGRPSIRRHATSIRFSDSARPTRRRIQSAHDQLSEEEGEECEGTSEISVEMDSCVSTLELVQLQMEKSGGLGVWFGEWVENRSGGDQGGGKCVGGGLGVSWE
jgi:hypothetical protein